MHDLSRAKFLHNLRMSGRLTPQRNLCNLGEQCGNDMTLTHVTHVTHVASVSCHLPEATPPHGFSMGDPTFTTSAKVFKHRKSCENVAS